MEMNNPDESAKERMSSVKLKTEKQDDLAFDNSQIN